MRAASLETAEMLTAVTLRGLICAHLQRIDGVPEADAWRLAEVAMGRHTGELLARDSLAKALTTARQMIRQEEGLVKDP